MTTDEKIRMLAEAVLNLHYGTENYPTLVDQIKAISRGEI